MLRPSTACLGVLGIPGSSSGYVTGVLRQEYRQKGGLQLPLVLERAGAVPVPCQREPVAQRRPCTQGPRVQPSADRWAFPVLSPMYGGGGLPVMAV